MGVHTGTRHVRSMAMLFLLASAVQVYLVGRCTLPAQDVLRSIQAAQELERHGLLKVLRENPESPFFGSAVLVVRKTLVGLGWLDPRDWARAAQITSAAAQALCVIPVYAVMALARSAFLAWIGSLYFIALAVPARLGADGLPDSLHLLLALMAAYAFAVYFLRGTDSIADRTTGANPEEHATARTSPGHRPALLLWVAAGFSGMAILIRPEGVVIPVAAGMLMVAGALSRRCATSLRFAMACLSIIAVACGMFVMPYLALSGVRSVSAAKNRLLGHHQRPFELHLNQTNLELAQPPVREVWFVQQRDKVTQMRFGKKDPTSTERVITVASSAGRFFRELAEGFQYVVGGLALLGYGAAFRAKKHIVDRFLLTATSLLLAICLVYCLRQGYLSSRHLLLVIAFTLPWAADGTKALAGTLHRRVSQSAWLGERKRFSEEWVSGWVAATLTLLLAIPHCNSLRGLETPHREAASWLNEHASPDDAVLDSRGYSGLLTGLTTYGYEVAQTAFSDPNLRFIVVRQEELEYDTRRASSLNSLLRIAGTEEARFFTKSGNSQREVIVYRWEPRVFETRRAALNARKRA